MKQICEPDFYIKVISYIFLDFIADLYASYFIFIKAISGFKISFIS